METWNLHDDLQQVYEILRKSPQEECSKPAQLLQQYQDVFARDEYSIDVQGAKHVKQ